MKLTIILIALVVSVPRSHAQHMNEKDSPCAEVGVTSDMVECLSKAKRSSDERLNSVYAEIRKRLAAADAERLTVAQRLWIKYRDANCLAERELYEGGTAYYPAYLACIEAMARQRTKELEVTYVVTLK